MNATCLLMLLRRLAAFLYDSLLLLALAFFITGIAIYFNNGQALESVAYKLSLIPIAGIFFCWFWKNGGQTLGMRAWRIKVVNNDDTKLTWANCFVRFGAGVLLFALTFIYALIDKDCRTLHDRLSSTRIAREKKE